MRKNLALFLRITILSLSLWCVSCVQESEKSCAKLKTETSRELIDEVKQQALSSASGEQYLSFLNGHVEWAFAANQKIGACMGLEIAKNSPESEIQMWRKTGAAVSWIVVSAAALSAKGDRAGWQSSRESLIKFIDTLDAAKAIPPQTK